MEPGNGEQGEERVASHIEDTAIEQSVSRKAREHEPLTEIQIMV